MFGTKPRTPPIAASSLSKQLGASAPRSDTVISQAGRGHSGVPVAVARRLGNTRDRSELLRFDKTPEQPAASVRSVEMPGDLCLELRGRQLEGLTSQWPNTGDPWLEWVCLASSVGTREGATPYGQRNVAAAPAVFVTGRGTERRLVYAFPSAVPDAERPRSGTIAYESRSWWLLDDSDVIRLVLWGYSEFLLSDVFIGIARSGEGTLSPFVLWFDHVGVFRPRVEPFEQLAPYIDSSFVSPRATPS